MGNYTVRADFRQERTFRNSTAGFEMDLDFNEEHAAGAAQFFLSSLASCKLVSLLELRNRFNMEISEAFVEVHGMTGRTETVEGTRFPIFRFKKIEYVFHVRTDHSDEELKDYLRFVNAACTMGNSISEKIEQIYRFIRI